MLKSHYSNYSFNLYLPDGYRSQGMPPVPFNEWHHFACSFTDPDEEDRFQVFYDGTTSGTRHAFSPTTSSTGSGRVVIGRAFINVDNSYTSLELDELLFFNRALQKQEILTLYQQHV